MTLRERIITEAGTWIGVPYVHGQHTRWGTDCIGLLVGVAKAVGCLPPDWAPVPYSSDWYLHNDTSLLKQGIEALGGTAVPLASVQPGDAILFQYDDLVAHHAGILLPGPCLIHAQRRSKRVICHSFHVLRHQAVDSAYAFPGVR